MPVQIDPDDMHGDEFLDVLTPKRLPWECFEDEVAIHIESQIRDGNLPLHLECCRITRKKPFYSKARESEIIFDVALECLPSPDATEPYLIWLWECKDYPTRTVGVDEVEEFADKMRQVAAHKGTIATRVGFQAGAKTLAKSYKIGLVVLNKERHCIVQFSQLGGLRVIIELTSSFSQDSTGRTFGDSDLESFMYNEMETGGV